MDEHRVVHQIDDPHLLHACPGVKFQLGAAVEIQTGVGDFDHEKHVFG